MLYRNETGNLIIKNVEAELLIREFFKKCDTVDEIEWLKDFFIDVIDNVTEEFIESIEDEKGGIYKCK